jgi:excisionase family DNA binding protein
MAEPLLTFDEVSALLRVKKSTLRAWRLRRYGLDFVVCGRLVRVTRSSVERYISENTVPARREAV